MAQSYGCPSANQSKIGEDMLIDHMDLQITDDITTPKQSRTKQNKALFASRGPTLLNTSASQCVDIGYWIYTIEKIAVLFMQYVL